MKKLGLIIGIFIGIIIILFLFASCSKGGSSSKIKSIRTDMVQYAYKYYQKKENKDDLPQDDGSSTSLSLKKIIQLLQFLVHFQELLLHQVHHL